MVTVMRYGRSVTAQSSTLVARPERSLGRAVLQHRWDAQCTRTAALDRRVGLWDNLDGSPPVDGRLGSNDRSSPNITSSTPSTETVKSAAMSEPRTPDHDANQRSFRSLAQDLSAEDGATTSSASADVPESPSLANIVANGQPVIDTPTPLDTGTQYPRPPPSPSDWGEEEPFGDWGDAASVRSEYAAGWDSSFSQGMADGAAGPAPQPSSWAGYGPTGATNGTGRPVAPEAAWQAAQQQQQRQGWRPDQQQQQPRPSEDATAGSLAFHPSDITLLMQRETERLLPLAPTPPQAAYYQPRTLQERIVQLMGSVGASVILSKTALLAAPILLYPIWSPWIRAGLRNLEVTGKAAQLVGLWRAQVLDVAVEGNPFQNMWSGPSAGVVRLLVGDPWEGGARARLEFPYQPRTESIQVGEAAELLVLSNDRSFSSFKVVRELYLPEAGVWLAEYPFLQRDEFLALSLDIERARRAAAAGVKVGDGMAAGYSYRGRGVGTTAGF